MIKIFNDNQVNEEKTVHLKLEQLSDTTILLRACDESGEPLAAGKLLRINEDGVYMYSDVSNFVKQYTPFKYDGKSALCMREDS